MSDSKKVAIVGNRPKLHKFDEDNNPQRGLIITDSGHFEAIKELGKKSLAAQQIICSSTEMVDQIQEALKIASGNTAFSLYSNMFSKTPPESIPFEYISHGFKYDSDDYLDGPKVGDRKVFSSKEKKKKKKKRNQAKKSKRKNR